MHTRRVSSFLLGVWLAGSLFMAYAQIISLKIPGLVVYSQEPAVKKITQTIGTDQADLLLRHSFAELVRQEIRNWEQVQIALGLVLGFCLIRATQMKILPLILCGVMLVFVMFEYLAITPEMTFRGRETDFPPGNAVLGSVARVWALQQVYVGLEIVKLIVGGVLASYLFVFRTSRRRRDEVDAEPALKSRRAL